MIAAGCDIQARPRGAQPWASLHAVVGEGCWYPPHDAGEQNLTSGSGPPPFSRRDPPGDAPGADAPEHTAPRLNGSARHDEPVVDLRTPHDATSLRPDAAPSFASVVGGAAGADPTDPWEPLTSRPWNPADRWGPHAGGQEPVSPADDAGDGGVHRADPLFEVSPVGSPHEPAPPIERRLFDPRPSPAQPFAAQLPGDPELPLFDSGSQGASTPLPLRDDPPAQATTSAQGALASGILRLLVAPVLALAVAVLLAAVLVQRSDAQEDRAAELALAAVEQREIGATVDRLWSGVLGLVASGVGQEVVAPAAVQELVGQVRAAAPSEASADPGAGARATFVDAVDAALAASASDPLELGNSLAELDALHDAAAEGSRAAALDLDDRASAERDGAARTDLLALAVVALGLVLSALAFLRVRSQLHDRIELPVARLRDAVRRFGEGDIGVRAHAGGAPELSELGRELDDVLGELGARIDELHRRAKWGEQSRMILDALDLVDDEQALFEVATRALGVIDPNRPVELLMVERSPSRLTLVASNPHLPPPGDPVDTHGVCVALRRGQVTVFDSTSSINSCPMLRARAGMPVSGACVPVVVSGRPVGVLHMTGPEHHPPDAEVVERLVSLASQIGNRLGSLRTLESTRQEAATDGLTGLPNRRALEAEVAQLLDRGTPFVMVLADLDKFKRLNDNFGHEVGDKALQLFAGVLRDNVRGNDVVARLGGEEFVLVYPNMSVEISIEAIGRLRAALARAVAASTVPAFTCSFGVTHSSAGTDGESILRIADAGLLRAKELGGDQAVFADAEIAAAVFAEFEAADRAGERQHDDRR
jgi:diguanylate cyclase (GGDEF)-like protein